MANGSDKIYRYPNVGMVGGVSSGFAYKLKIQVWWIRAGWLIALFFGFPLLIYIALWILMPEGETPADYDEVCN